jgi:anionic cell wall polymer biosynthesis LytR-Cps2A-Psr (LCP) family protein
VGNTGLGMAVISVIIVIIFITVVAFILPTYYNKTQQSNQSHVQYCNYLKSIMDNPNDKNVNITIQSIKDYSANCSSK